MRAELLGFGKTRFHDLRGIHSTALLDAGIPCTLSHSGSATIPVLLKIYTKRKRSKQANEKQSDTNAGLAAGFLVGRVSKPVSKPNRQHG